MDIQKLRVGTAREILILKTLYETRHSPTVNEVAEKAGMSWNTAEKYLEQMHTKRWVIKLHRNKRDYYTVHKK